MKHGPGDHRGDREDPHERVVALVVAGGAAQEPSHAVEPGGERQRQHQRGDHPEEGDRDAGDHRAVVVVDLGPHPQPRGRLRPPQRKDQQRWSPSTAAASARRRGGGRAPRSGSPR